MTLKLRRLCLCILGISLCCAVWASPVLAMTFLTMGTGSPGGNYYTFGQLFAQVVNANSVKTGIRVKAVPSKGSVDNITGLSQGSFQLGLAQADMDFQAWKGEGPWQKAGPQKSLRSLYEIYTEGVTCIATVPSGVKSCGDLRGKRVALGAEGSGTLVNARQALGLCMLRPSDLGQALYVSPAEAMRLMYQGKLDAFFYTVGHPNLTLKSFLEHYGKARAVPLPPTMGMLRNKPYYVKYLLWRNDYPALQNRRSSVDTFGIATFILTNDKVPADVVYELTRTFLANLAVFKKQMKVMRGVEQPQRTNLKDLTWNVGAPYHAGVEKLFKELGIL